MLLICGCSHAEIPSDATHGASTTSTSARSFETAAEAPPQEPETRYAGRTLDEWRERIKNLNPEAEQSAAEVPGLMRLVEDESVPWFTRRQAALTLGRIGAPAREAVPLLVGLLDETGTGEESTPFWAMKALALFGPVAAEAGPPLARLAREPGRPVEQRESAVEALSQIGTAHPIAIPTLIAAVEGTLATGQESPADRDVLRELAAEALTALGPSGASAAPALIRAARDESEFLRIKAAAALGAMGGQAEIAVPALVELLVLDESAFVRDAAGTALAGVGPSARPALESLLEDRSAEVRWRAAKSLGDLGPAGRPAVPALTAALKDPDETVRMTAAEALWGITPRAEPLLPTLLDALASDERAIRIRSSRLLTAMGARAAPALDGLRKLAGDDRPHVRQAAEKTLRDVEAAAATSSTN